MIKHDSLIIIGLLWISILCASSKLQAQCNTQTYKDICIRKIPEYFVFSKSYELSEEVSEFEIFFNSLTAYVLIADSYRTNIEVYRSEDDGEKRLVKTAPAYLSYVAPVTGKYYLRFTFKETDEHCGAAVLCFLR